MNNHPKAQVTINLEAVPNEVCGAEPEQQAFKQEGTCTSKEFTKVFQYKRISALVSPNGREQVLEMQFVRCLACGAQKVIK